jgi:hypothetical protein
LLNTDAILVVAERNWWGNENGPAPTGSGDLVSGAADYDPWLCSGVDTDPATGFQPANDAYPYCAGPVTSNVTPLPNPAWLNALVTVTATVDDSTTGGSTIASAEYSLNGSAWSPMAALDGAFDEVSEDVSAAFLATQPGTNTVCVRGTDVAGYTGDPTCAEFSTRTYQFFGFYSPIDMGKVNIAKAGQAIPVKWRLTDANGTPISDPASFSGLYSYKVSCADFSGDPLDAIEEYASGSSGLQYNGDGYWQFNWKTLKSYTNTCVVMFVRFNDGTTSPEVQFQFKK